MSTTLRKILGVAVRLYNSVHPIFTAAGSEASESASEKRVVRKMKKWCPSITTLSYSVGEPATNAM